ncbi:Fruit bromelain, partial [Tetrabaena socialis]
MTTSQACINKFSDLTVVEKAKFLGLGKRRTISLAQTGTLPTRPGLATAAVLTDSQVPDWSAILPIVKHQGLCGACWAFAASGMAEAGHYINTQEIISLSEKQQVDCNLQNSACAGGSYDNAFTYIINTGLTTTEVYPYVAQNGTCPAPLPAFASKLQSYVPLATNDEVAMLQALANGPIAVAVCASNDWFDYTGGVFSSDQCGGDLNHAVIVVGAGTDSESNEPYWLIRNSWGGTWGEAGHIRLLRGTTVGGRG